MLTFFISSPKSFSLCHCFKHICLSFVTPSFRHWYWLFPLTSVIFLQICMTCFSTFSDFPCSNIISAKPFVIPFYKIATFSLFFAVFASISSILWRRQWHPTPVFLPGKSHGWRCLVGYSPRGRWGLDTTERLHFHFSLACIGEGNGNPLQCSCLENPRDGGASWAAVCGVTQSQTWLKWLSSSSSSSSILYALLIFLYFQLYFTL